MIVSDARRAANRRNALRSTGPRTEEGKEVARRNALKHGLTAVVDTDDSEDWRERAEDFRLALRPKNEWQAWLSAAIALTSVRLDRAAWVERRLRGEACWRAWACWDEDQRLEVERLAEKLAHSPARVVAELRRSPYGCGWLIDRWAMLANVADRQPWTPEQATLANNLLGTPLEVRDDAPEQIIDADGRSALPLRPQAEVAREMIADLAALRDRMAEADEVARSLARADRNDAGTPDLKRLRRYERDLEKRLQWYVEQFHAAAPPTIIQPEAFSPLDPFLRPSRDAPAEVPPAPAPVAPRRNEPIPIASIAETNPFLPPIGRTILPEPQSQPGPIGLPLSFSAHWEPKPTGRGQSNPSKRRPDLKKLAARISTFRIWGYGEGTAGQR